MLAVMATDKTDQKARQYWSQQLDEAHALMQRLYSMPVEECGEEMVSLRQAAADAGVEVTFSDRPHAEGRPRLFYLRTGLIPRFLDVARAMDQRGWVLHVEDAYRTRSMQGGLWKEATFASILEKVRWELGGAAPTEEFLFRRVAALLAPCPKAGGHLSGAAVDVSVFRRADRGELDRDGPYLEISEKTPMASPFVSTEATKNRRAISEVFEKAGFAPYPYEFWHYNRGDVLEAAVRGQPGPARYGPVDFDPATGKVTPVPNATEPFLSLADIRRKIAQAMDQGGRG